MPYNVPDDWDNYWTTCDRGHRFHASEGFCDACELQDEFEAGLTDEDLAYYDDDYFEEPDDYDDWVWDD